MAKLFKSLGKKILSVLVVVEQGWRKRCRHQHNEKSVEDWTRSQIR